MSKINKPRSSRGTNAERERVRLLIRDMVGLHKRAARKIREDGSYTVRQIWPFGKTVTRVRPGWERAAQGREAIITTLEVLDRCIADGYDPRKEKP